MSWGGQFVQMLIIFVCQIFNFYKHFENANMFVFKLDSRVFKKKFFFLKKIGQN